MGVERWFDKDAVMGRGDVVLEEHVTGCEVDMLENGITADAFVVLWNFVPRLSLYHLVLEPMKG
jgi:hypothetical protein